MQFFERQTTITRNLQRQIGDGFYRTNYGADSAFTLIGASEDDGFEQTMRETKMDFFFSDQREKPSRG